MSGPFYYYNTMNNKVSTSVQINFCRKDGPQSFCGAASVADQRGCKHREDATNADHCLYYRSTFNGACDSVWAQTDTENPNKHVKKS